MFIECPSCHARAQLPDSKEGAKVRCSECSSVYEALPGGAGPRRASEAVRPPVYSDIPSWQYISYLRMADLDISNLTTLPSSFELNSCPIVTIFTHDALLILKHHVR